MRAAVLGAGMMGRAVAMDLASSDGVEQVLILDVDPERAAVVASDCLGRGEARPVDAGAGGLIHALHGADVAVACLPYRANLDAMRACLEAGSGYVDLGGLFHMTLRQLELDEAFRERGLTAVLGAGSAPGLTNLLAAAAAGGLDEVHSVETVVGRTITDRPSEGWTPHFSAETILDECSLPGFVFEDGELREVPPLSNPRRYRLPDPVGEVDAVVTIHSELATLPAFFADRGIREAGFRLHHDPHDLEALRLLVGLGFASEEPVDVGDARVAPRDLLLARLAALPPSKPTAQAVPRSAISAFVRGTKDGAPVTREAHIVVSPHPVSGNLVAVATGIPASIVAQLVGRGETPVGVASTESAITGRDDFFRTLAGRGSFDVRLPL
jgi:saccharopine dehydrogenase-like NADP-dependent oxidoreductase